jgi:D-aspartate ligase
MSGRPENRSVTGGAPTAVVLNLYHTGLGITRSLGARGVPVVGITSERGVFGNFSRYGRTLHCADSRSAPETLLNQLIQLGQTLGRRSVLFPTRDHDLVFLDRFRSELEPYYSLVVPEADALERCLNKWRTGESAAEAGVRAPKAWLIESTEDLHRQASEMTFPCVLKPLAAHHWRGEGNWQIVGARKAIGVTSAEELFAVYATTAQADPRALVQEQIPGTDDQLIVAACYIDRRSTFRAGFTVQKLIQDPPGFGTGCVVQTIDRPELFDRTVCLLKAMGFTGLAEVEYKWDARCGDYQLIEVNPRPWDQHRLGTACDVDLVYLAYCDHAGLPLPDMPVRFRAQKWIAEDAMIMAVLRMLWRRQHGVRGLLSQARGSRQFAIWSLRDPLPFAAYAVRMATYLLKGVFDKLRRAPENQTTAGKSAVRVAR